MNDSLWRRKYAGIGLADVADASLSQLFHENTKLSRLSGREYATHLERVRRSPELLRTLSNPYKVYSLSDGVEIGQVEATRDDLERVIEARRSVRTFSGQSLRRGELSRLLWYAYGRMGPRRDKRPVPSPGAVYPLELYVIALNVEGIGRGLYHYNVEKHFLDVISAPQRAEGALDVLWLQEIDTEGIAAVLVICGLFRRCTVKYLDRGYRMVLMEAGAVVQNVSLMGTALGLGTCAVGGFLDDELSDLLTVDGVAEAPLLAVVLGRPQESASGAT